MASLTASEETQTALPRIPAHTQLLAVAWLRWRIFVNNFQRRRSGKSSVIGLIVIIFLRIIVWAILGFGMIGAAVLCGYLAWKSVAGGSTVGLISLLTGISIAWQFLSINGLSVAASVPNSNLDPSSLLRFPLRFGRYLFLRILLGLLTGTTIAGCLTLLAAAIGIGIADHAFLLPAVVVLTVYAWMNIFLTRMIDAWFERWLAVRRFREVFSVVMALFFVGIQFLNLGGLSSSPQRAERLFIVLHGAVPLLHWLPPGFSANAIILAAAHPVTALVQFSALLAFTVLFLYVFAIRIHKQFLGEYLSEGTVRTLATSAGRVKVLEHPLISPARSEPARPRFSPVIIACLRKEWASLKGNSTQLLAIVTPLLLIFVMNRGFGQRPTLFLPSAIAYVLFVQIASLYNIFGADGPGVQLYLLAPIRLRDVVIAKNVVSLALLLTEVMLAWAVVCFRASTAIPWSVQASAALWTLFVIAVNLTLGTVRSIQAPRKFIPGQTRQTRSTPMNRTSSLLVLAALFGSLLLQAPVVLLAGYFRQPWLGALIFAPLAAGAVIGYALLLRSSDRLILRHRDTLCEELCKV